MATPDLANESVMAFCREHFPGGRPRLVPAEAAPWALVAECFPNVRRAVESEGGAMMLGWHLWELPGLLLEAEFHAIWRKPSGRTVDITPQLEGFQERTILFVPTPKARLQKEPPDNLRRPLSDDADLHDLCRIKHELTKFRSRGRPEGEAGAYTLTGADAQAFHDLHQTNRALLARLKDRYPQQFAGFAT